MFRCLHLICLKFIIFYLFLVSASICFQSFVYLTVLNYQICTKRNFLDKLDITYVTPGRKDHRYVEKVDGKSQYVRKRYLMWTLNDLLNIANGSSLIKNE